MPPPPGGSRTAAYLVSGALATVPALFVLMFLGPLAAIGGVVTLWTSGVLWILRKRQEDPGWDRRTSRPGTDEEAAS
jgi:hypothetical protein